MDNKKYAIFFVLFILISLGLSVVSAQTVDDTNITDVSDVSANTVDDNSNIQKIITKNEKTIEKTSTEQVSDYKTLTDKISQIKDDTENDEVTIELNEGKYDVSTPIVWGNTKKVKTLTINGNNQILTGNNNQFITILNGYTLNLNNIVINSCENTKDGGAIINKGTLNINNVTLENNKANFGGALLNYNDLKVTDSKFINNTATNGGALANTNYAKATIINTEFISNSADTMGGAVDNEHYSTMTITNSRFEDNSATNGAAIDNNQATLTLTDNKITNNNAKDYAGGLYNRLFATVEMYNNIFTNNLAGDDGGAIYNYFNTTLIGENNIFENNTAINYGGAIYNDEATLIFTNNTIQKNNVVNYGGIFYNTNYANGHLYNNTIVNNTVKTNGGAFYASSSNLELDGNIISDNTARQGGACYLIQYCNVNITNNIFENNYAETNAGAIYTNSVNLMQIIANIINNNTANSGAALYSTGGNVLFNDNKVTNNNVINPANKVIFNTGTLTASNNEFVNNTNGQDILMTESGKNTINDNKYEGNLLETTISPINVNIIGDTELKIIVNAKEVYNTKVNTGKITVSIDGTEYATQDVTEAVTKITLKEEDIVDKESITVKYTPENNDFQESEITTNINKGNDIKVSSYEELYDTIERIKENTQENEFIINLEEGNYEVTTPIEWTDSVNVKTLTINGNNQEIKGNSKNFITIGEENTLNLNDLTIAYCESSQDGGAINNEGTLNINNVIFQNNKANYGGAVVSHNIITIENSQFINNTASNGGALANTNYATATITNTTFDSNSAVTMGGAVYNEHYSTMTITDSTFTNNNANNGGAIDNDQATLTLENNLFKENTCLDYGGAIYNRFYATLNMKNNIFDANDAIEDEGGVLYNYFKSEVTAENNTFINNHAFRYGGFVFNDDSDLQLINNILINNTVTKFGGAVIYDANGATATFINNTITKNSGLSNGGAVYVASSDLELIGNTFTENTCRQGAALYFIGASDIKVINNTISDNIGETNGGAIYNTVNKVLTVTGNTIENNVAGQGAVLYSTGEVIFNNNIVRNNMVTNPANKIIYSTKALNAENNVFENNTDGTDMLMSDSGNNNINDNQYTNNFLESLINNGDIEINDDYTLLVNVTGKTVYNTPVTGGKIIVYLNDKEYATTSLKDGLAEVPFTLRKLNDENTVKIEYVSDNDDFQSSETTFTMKNVIEKEGTIIKINKIQSVELGDKAVITGTYKTATGTTLKSTTMNVLVNDVEYTAKTNSKGQFTLEVTGDIVGTNNVTVSFAGNGRYQGANATATFYVKEDTVITINPISEVTYTNKVTITGKYATTSGLTLKYTTMTIMVNGEKYTARTNGNGEFTLELNAKTVGTNDVVVNFAGNSRFNGANATATFEVTKQDLALTINPIETVNKGENVTIGGTFKDANGVTIKSTTVKLNINGKTVNAKTNAKGVFNYTYTTTTTGTNTVVASFAGNDRYAKVTTETTFVVN